MPCPPPPSRAGRDADAQVLPCAAVPAQAGGSRGGVAAPVAGARPPAACYLPPAHRCARCRGTWPACCSAARSRSVLAPRSSCSAFAAACWPAGSFASSAPRAAIARLQVACAAAHSAPSPRSRCPAATSAHFPSPPAGAWRRVRPRGLGEVPAPHRCTACAAAQLRAARTSTEVARARALERRAAHIRYVLLPCAHGVCGRCLARARYESMRDHGQHHVRCLRCGLRVPTILHTDLRPATVRARPRRPLRTASHRARACCPRPALAAGAGGPAVRAPAAP